MNYNFNYNFPPLNFSDNILECANWEFNFSDILRMVSRWIIIGVVAALIT